MRMLLGKHVLAISITFVALQIGIIVGSTTKAPVFKKQPPADEILFAAAEEASRLFLIECEAEGSPEIAYKWKKNGLDFDPYSTLANGRILSSNRSRGTLEFVAPLDEDAGHYQCFATNLYGTAMSNSVFVRKAWLNSFKDDKTLRISADEGKPFQLPCAVPNSYPKALITWVLLMDDGALKSIDSPRILVDPNGTLWFSNVTREDNSSSLNALYACSAFSIYRDKYKIGNKIFLHVVPAKNSGSPKTFPPTRQFTSTDVVVELGEQIELWCIVGGTPLPEIEWSKQGRIEGTLFLTDATSKMFYKKRNATQNDGGIYECKATNGVGTILVQRIKLQILVPPNFKIEPQPAAVIGGGTIELQCRAEGTPKPEIAWIHNGKLLEIWSSRIQQNHSLTTINTVDMSDSGKYGCNASNTVGYIYKEVYIEVLGSREEPINLSTIQFPFFNKDYVGVYFSPWVMPWIDNGPDQYYTPPSHQHLNVKIIQDMLEIISTEFKMLVIETNDTPPGENSNKLTAIAVQNINRKRGDELVLSVYVLASIQEALEANFDPGNVSGLIIRVLKWSELFAKIDRLNSTARRLRVYARRINIGILITDCVERLVPPFSRAKLNEVLVTINILTCTLPMSSESDGHFSTILQKFLNTRLMLRNAYPNITMVIQTEIASDIYTTEKDTVEKMARYWFAVGKWAEANEFPVIFHDAIDQPFRTNLSRRTPEENEGPYRDWLDKGILGDRGHYGWWTHLYAFSDETVNSSTHNYELVKKICVRRRGIPLYSERYCESNEDYLVNLFLKQPKIKFPYFDKRFVKVQLNSFELKKLMDERSDAGDLIGCNLNDTSSRAFKTLQTLLEKVSSEFGEVYIGYNTEITAGQSYVDDSTVFETACKLGAAAAHLNRKHNQTLIGIHVALDLEMNDVDSRLQSIPIGLINYIHPGTILSINLYGSSESYLGDQIERQGPGQHQGEANEMFRINRTVALLGLPLTFSPLNCTEEIGELLSLDNLEQNLSFICQVDPNESRFLNETAENIVSIIGLEFLEIRAKIKKAKPLNIKIVVRSLCSNEESNLYKLKYSQNMGKFWFAFGKWAKENEFPIIMCQAFGTYDEIRHRSIFGWWDEPSENYDDLQVASPVICASRALYFDEPSIFRRYCKGYRLSLAATTGRNPKLSPTIHEEVDTREFPQFKDESEGQPNQSEIYVAIQYDPLVIQGHVLASSELTRLKIVASEFLQVFLPNSEINSTALVCARINAHENKNVLTVSQGMNPWSNTGFIQSYEFTINSTLKLALETNAIFPGTLSRLFVIWNERTHKNADELLKFVKEAALKVDAQNLTLGIATKKCQYLVTELKADQPKDKAAKKILQLVKVIVCETYPNKALLSEYHSSIQTLGNELIQWREVFQNFKKDLEIVLWSGWSTDSADPESVENMRDFWVKLERWAQINKFHVIFREAFDPLAITPTGGPENSTSISTKSRSNFGWWKPTMEKVDGQVKYEVKACENVSGSNFCKVRKKRINCIQDPDSCVVQRVDVSLLIWSGLIGLALFLIVGTLIMYILYRKHSWKTKSRQQQQEINILTAGLEKFLKGQPLEPGADSHLFSEAKALELDTKYLTEFKNIKLDFYSCLGKGEFGLIYKGNIKGRRAPVAIKTIQSQRSHNYLEVLSEVKVMIYVGPHSNIVEFIATCIDNLRDNGTLYIVVEFCTKGSLDLYLRSEALESGRKSNKPVVHFKQDLAVQYENTIELNSDSDHDEKSGQVSISAQEMDRWAFEIACGMDFLANKKLVHADLATRNVLLTENKVAKISDFGLSRKLAESKDYVKLSATKMPFKWMAIESLTEYKMSTESDVWAFGVTLWEIYSKGEDPYQGLGWSTAFLENLKNGYRLEIPKFCSTETFQMMQKCWSKEPSARPTFNKLKSYFNKISSDSDQAGCN